MTPSEVTAAVILIACGLCGVAFAVRLLRRERDRLATWRRSAAGELDRILADVRPLLLPPHKWDKIDCVRNRDSGSLGALVNGEPLRIAWSRLPEGGYAIHTQQHGSSRDLVVPTASAPEVRAWEEALAGLFWEKWCEENDSLDRQRAAILASFPERQAIDVRRDDYKRTSPIDRLFRKRFEMRILRACGNRCFHCRTDVEIELDHAFIPKNEGGNFAVWLPETSLWLNNALPLCRQCNASKGDRRFDAFFSAQQMAALKAVQTELSAEINREWSAGRDAVEKGQR